MIIHLCSSFVRECKCVSLDWKTKVHRSKIPTLFPPIGGALGGAYARWRYKGKHDVVADVLRGLEEKQLEELREQFKDIVEDYPEDDFMMMTRRLNEDGELRERLRLKLKSFLTDTLKRILVEEYKQRGKAD